MDHPHKYAPFALKNNDCFHGQKFKNTLGSAHDVFLDYSFFCLIRTFVAIAAQYKD